MSKKVKMHGPFTISLEIMYTDGDKVANVTWEGPYGRIVSPKEYQKIIDKTTKEVQEQLGEDWSPADKELFFDYKIAEQTGTYTKFAMPGNPDWDEYEEE